MTSQSGKAVETLQAADAFSYACTRCGRCCQDKRIQINPYEAARLSRNRGIALGEFRARYTQDGQGVVLAHNDTGGCIFFGDQGCSVHADRPLVCRLYPLGRHVTADGHSHFSKGHFDPEPAGLYGHDGQVADFVAQQGAGDFIAAADGYFQWYVKATQGDAAAMTTDYDDLLDLDAVVSRHCSDADIDEPDDIAARLNLHFAILDQLITPKGAIHD